MTGITARTLVLIGLFALIMGGRARAETPAPPELDQVDVLEHPGRQLPLDLSFVDSSGRPVRLGQTLSARRPLLLTLVYFNCPMLCSTVLSGMVRSLSAAGIRPGTDIDLLTVSFDPADRAGDAAEKRRHYLQAAGLSDDGTVWPFLTGTEASIRELAAAVGFRYAHVAHTSEFAHAAVLFVVTPSGNISRYLYGIDFSTRDLRLSVSEASGGKWGDSLDRFLLHCFRYNPATRRYGIYISTYFKLGGLLILAALMALIVFVSRKGRAKARHA